MKRFWLMRVTAVTLLACVLLPAHGAKGKKQTDDDIEKVSSKGRIDWTKGALYATGLGAVPRGENNDAIAYLKAREYASLDAMRNLLMVIEHVHVDARSTGADFVATSTVIRSEVEGLLKGPEIVAERKIKIGRDMMVEVTVRTRMYGDHSVASVFLPEEIKRHAEDPDAPKTVPDEPPGQDTVEPERALPQAEPAPEEGPRYTSVIIDTRGYRVERDMAPKICRGDGSELWGSVNVDPDYVIEHGIVIYTHSVADARATDRAGSHPLILHAIGAGRSPVPCNAMLSDADAAKLMSLNARDHFMDKFNVIFVVDPLH